MQIHGWLQQQCCAAEYIARKHPKKEKLATILANEEISRMTCGDQEELICGTVLMNYYCVGGDALRFGGRQYLLKLAGVQSLQEPRSQVLVRGKHIVSESGKACGCAVLGRTSFSSQLMIRRDARNLLADLLGATSRPPVLAQPKMEKRRSPLV